MQVRPTAGTGSAALGVIGTGLAMTLPNQKWIGIVLIILGCIVFIFDIRVEGGRLRLGNPRGRRMNYWGPWILIIGGPLVGSLWFYWSLGSLTTSPEHNITALTSNQTTGPILTPSQEQLLSLIAKYQRIFVVTKLIIGKDGTLYFDDDATKGKTVNFVIELYGSGASAHQKTFAMLMESLPLEYVRFFPEMRWNSPFVVSVTEHGMRYLRDRIP